jgi:GDPmannose 4,6-dehydratase
MSRIRHILDRVHLHAASLESFPSIFRIMERLQPDECYHLAAQSFVSYSFDDAFSTLTNNISATHCVLAALKDACPDCRFYFAGSSEMFGKAEEVPQTERTRFHPRSAYGISKVTGYELTRNHREAYGMHASAGILFNHESPRRGFEFVTRKITMGVARALLDKNSPTVLGNLEARRDWGHARDYVEAMWRMLQQDEPDDYVIATGETHSVRDFARLAFESMGLNYENHVVSDPELYRPAEVDVLRGDAAYAGKKLGWKPTVGFAELVTEMVTSDCRALGVPLAAMPAATG